MELKISDDWVNSIPFLSQGEEILEEQDKKTTWKKAYATYVYESVCTCKREKLPL